MVLDYIGTAVMRYFDAYSDGVFIFFRQAVQLNEKERKIISQRKKLPENFEATKISFLHQAT